MCLAVSLVLLCILKLKFPLEPDIVAVRMVQVAFFGGIAGFIFSLIGLPTRQSWLSLLLLVGAVCFFIFGWPLYEVF